jgi:hypothetical protein
MKDICTNAPNLPIQQGRIRQIPLFSGEDRDLRARPLKGFG